MKDFEKKVNRIPTIIINYPRSGSNFLNYCIKELVGFGLWKNHGQSYDFWLKERQDTIFLLRNYKECIPRQCNSYLASVIKKQMVNAAANKDNDIFDYISVLNYYHTLKKKKLLIYYEDLITNTEFEILRVIKFLKKDGVTLLNPQDFLINLDAHRKKSAAAYVQGSRTGGQVTIYHSKKINVADKKDIDTYLESTYPELWNKYLKRYKENWTSHS
jgi:hypothetical protein